MEQLVVPTQHRARETQNLQAPLSNKIRDLLQYDKNGYST